MKKAALILLCFSLLAPAGVTAYAAETNTAPGSAVVRTTVPRSHKVTVELIGEGSYTLNGSEGSVFEVERLSQPETTPPSGDSGDNPSTGILGGVSLGSTVLLGTLLTFRKRDKDSKDR